MRRGSDNHNDLIVRMRRGSDNHNDLIVRMRRGSGNLVVSASR